MSHWSMFAFLHAEWVAAQVALAAIAVGPACLIAWRAIRKEKARR